MATGRDRLRRQLLNPPTGDEPEAQQATVTGLGPPITVSWQGDTYRFPHLASYTPVVGHEVAMIRFAGSWLILGRPINFP